MDKKVISIDEKRVFPFKTNQNKTAVYYLIKSTSK